MPKLLGTTNFDHNAPKKIGVLLANLGTPEAPTRKALRVYLKEFLSDTRVIEYPRWLWWLILNLIILNVRPQKSAKLYQKIWRPEGSPLFYYSKRQQALLQERLDQTAPGRFKVALGMRYGNPSISSALRSLSAENCRELVVLPLYPQYFSATTGSTFDAAAAEITNWRWVPELRFIGKFHDHPLYIKALAESVRSSWRQGGKKDHLLISFHGIPKRYSEAGDPYYCHCQMTARLLVEELGIAEGDYTVAFQSRFGKEEWLTPYTDETIRELARSGKKAINVICPGFVSDCLETLEEIAEQNAEFFHEAGGEDLSYIPALNDDELLIALLEDLVVGAEGARFKT